VSKRTGGKCFGLGVWKWKGLRVKTVMSVSTCRETWRWRLKSVEKCVSVSWYKNVNRKIARGNSNIYLANRVLLED
jgi:hypothetical protein